VRRPLERAVLIALGFGLLGANEFLDALPAFLGDKRLVGAVVRDAVPIKITRVDPLAENLVNFALVQFSGAERESVFPLWLRAS
jgi:hypothetical protein